MTEAVQKQWLHPPLTRHTFYTFQYNYVLTSNIIFNIEHTFYTKYKLKHNKWSSPFSSKMPEKKSMTRKRTLEVCTTFRSPESLGIGSLTSWLGAGFGWQLVTPTATALPLEDEENMSRIECALILAPGCLPHPLLYLPPPKCSDNDTTVSSYSIFVG